MTDGLRKSHLRKAPPVSLSEVGLPEGNLPSMWLSADLLHTCVCDCAAYECLYKSKARHSFNFHQSAA